MEKVFNCYETLFITDVSNGEEATQVTVEKFTNLITANGEVLGVSKWGKRRLAYPINDMPEGYYTIVTHKCAPDFLAELDRLFNIDESIMRSMTVKLEHEPVIAPVVEEEPVVEAVEEAAPAVEEAAPAVEEAAEAAEAATDAE